jgi:uncharacterized delta-60 repeat protein
MRTGKLVCLMLACVATRGVCGADGALDSTFGLAGRATIQWPLGDAEPAAVAGDDAGRIVVAGQTRPYGQTSEMFLARLTSAGALDSSFASSGDGFFRYDFNLNGIGPYGGNSANAVVVGSDGHVTAAGCANIDANQSHFALIRVDAQGIADAGFGSNGAAHFGSPFSLLNCAYALRNDADSRLVVAGYSAHQMTENDSSVLQYYASAARLTPGGHLDAEFLSGGVSELIYWVEPSSGGIQNAMFNAANDVGIDGFGRIITAGQTDTPNPLNGAAARLLDDGTVDQTYGSHGRYVLDLTQSIVDAEFVSPSGMTMLAGLGIDGQGHSIVFLLKLTPEGVPDSTFGTSGLASFTFDGAGLPMLVAPTRRGGWLIQAAARRTGVLLIRTDSAGNPDPTFGVDGLVNVVYESEYSVLFDAKKATLQADGKLVVAGFVPEAANNGDFDFAVMRILADYDTLFVSGFEPP